MATMKTTWILNDDALVIKCLTTKTSWRLDGDYIDALEVKC